MEQYNWKRFQDWLISPTVKTNSRLWKSINSHTHNFDLVKDEHEIPSFALDVFKEIKKKHPDTESLYISRDGLYVTKSTIQSQYAGNGLFIYVPVTIPDVHLTSFIGLQTPEKQWDAKWSKHKQVYLKKQEYIISFQNTQGETIIVDPTDHNGNLYHPQINENVAPFMNQPPPGKTANCYSFWFNQPSQNSGDFKYPVDELSIMNCSPLAPFSELFMVYGEAGSGSAVEEAERKIYPIGNSCGKYQVDKSDKKDDDDKKGKDNKEQKQIQQEIDFLLFKANLISSSLADTKKQITDLKEKEKKEVGSSSSKEMIQTLEKQLIDLQEEIMGESIEFYTQRDKQRVVLSQQISNLKKGQQATNQIQVLLQVENLQQKLARLASLPKDEKENKDEKSRLARLSKDEKSKLSKDEKENKDEKSRLARLSKDENQPIYNDELKQWEWPLIIESEDGNSVLAKQFIPKNTLIPFYGIPLSRSAAERKIKSNASKYVYITPQGYVSFEPLDEILSIQDFKNNVKPLYNEAIWISARKQEDLSLSVDLFLSGRIKEPSMDDDDDEADEKQDSKNINNVKFSQDFPGYLVTTKDIAQNEELFNCYMMQYNRSQFSSCYPAEYKDPNFEITQSRIQNQGKGVFAKQKFKKNNVIMSADKKAFTSFIQSTASPNVIKSKTNTIIAKKVIQKGQELYI